MRRPVIALCSVALFLAGVALAGPPLAGSYNSTDIGGSVLVGRYTEGWAAGGGGLLTGATLNCASWDGFSLGTQWRYWCGTQVSNSVLLINTVNAQGNGNRTYASTYVGGYFWLSGTGPWANGDAAYPGVMDSYVEYETIQYSNWNQIGAITNVQMSAHFDNYPEACMSYNMGNGLRVSDTNLGQPAPANYPQFLDTNCNSGPTEGAGWNFFTITLTIVDCSVGSEETTWGAVKSIYAR
jgi:hypothetical protein